MTRLPESVEEIAGIIGRHKALFLIGQMPPSGSRSWRVCFYVPKRIKPDHYLVRILGWRDAQRLVRHFGGEIMQTSNCNFLHREFRNQEIWRMSNQGWSATQIADAVDLSVYHVRDLLRGQPPEETSVTDYQDSEHSHAAV